MRLRRHLRLSTPSALCCVALLIWACQDTAWREIPLPGPGAERLSGWWLDAFDAQPMLGIGRGSAGWVLRAPRHAQFLGAFAGTDQLEIAMLANGQLVTVALPVQSARGPATSGFELYIPMAYSGAWVHDPDWGYRLATAWRQLRRILRHAQVRLTDAVLDIF